MHVNCQKKNGGADETEGKVGRCVIPTSACLVFGSIGEKAVTKKYHEVTKLAIDVIVEKQKMSIL